MQPNRVRGLTDANGMARIKLNSVADAQILNIQVRPALTVCFFTFIDRCWSGSVALGLFGLLTALCIILQARTNNIHTVRQATNSIVVHPYLTESNSYIHIGMGHGCNNNDADDDEEEEEEVYRRLMLLLLQKAVKLK